MKKPEIGVPCFAPSVRLMVGVFSAVLFVAAALVAYNSHHASVVRARQLAERQQRDSLLNTVRQWPTISDLSLRGSKAMLSTVCRIEQPGWTGRLHYRLVVSPAESLLVPTPTEDSLLPDAATTRDEREWQRFRRRQAELRDHIERRLRISGPKLAIHFYDADGFVIRTIDVPPHVPQSLKTPEGTDLVANGIDTPTCGDEVLRFASWGLSHDTP